MNLVVMQVFLLFLFQSTLILVDICMYHRKARLGTNIRAFYVFVLVSYKFGV